ncbi:aldo/keto reductase [Plebeiibacterium sediminum]|uniref:Aldo/keto reductase n=1 Tax=Plebeiibacterium sediminum TaxID=2992112 RepID=A0AAE3M552_9BACT|nr:aldo/keto reductase [Plebeiobacterium sediminum]MCW3787309.1 aldo/keto reductase [Plebeiobacterium sediminum]
MNLDEKYTLSNGVEVPKLGLGTWFISNKNVGKAVVDAIKLGYRHIDTAQAYRNEKGVGEGVKASGIERRDMFITTKLGAGIKSYNKAIASIDKSIQKIGLDYLDMMIIHSPQPWTKFRGEDAYFEGNLEAWRALEDACQAGKIRAIGLSNFQQADVENILASCTIKPAVNQILAHISNTPAELIQYCQQNNILVEAYSPIGHGELFKNTKIAAIAKRYQVTVPQLSIRYCLQLGLLPLPKTANPAHMQNNADLDFLISEKDMEILKYIEPIKDYSKASVMPVYGGKLNFKSIMKMIFSTK